MNLKQLRAAIESCPYPHYKGKNNDWLSHRLRLREHILNPSEGDVQSYPAWFMYWSTIQATMYVGQAPYIQRELEAVLELYPSDICKLSKFFHEPVDWNGLSTNLIHQAYHLVQYESKLNIRIRDLDTIIEFGGGYGAMALVAFRMGFNGIYYIYDLPEFSILQQYFLSHQPDIGTIHWRRNGGAFSQKEFDLCIAIHSISELDSVVKRWNFLNNYQAMSYIFSYNRSQKNIDNLKWFEQMQEKIDMEWVNWEIEHLPDRYYLVGAE